MVLLFITCFHGINTSLQQAFVNCKNLVKDAYFVLKNYFYNKSFVLKLTAIPKMESFEYSPSSFLLHVFVERVDEDEVSNLTL